MANHPVSSRAHRCLVIALAVSLVGCKSSSARPPGMDGDGDGGGIDVVVAGDDVEGDATSEDDSAIDAGSDGAGTAGGDAIADAGAGVDGPDGSATEHELCNAACMVTAKVAACPQALATCVARCDQQAARGVCLAALRALLQCQAEAGPEAYDCVSSVGVMLKPGVCASEIKKSADCRSGDAGLD